MSYSEFIHQISILMHNQQIKQMQNDLDRSNYGWLSSRRCVLTFLTAKDEFQLRSALQKVSLEQRTKAMHQLLSWLEVYPYAEAQKIPEICILILNKYQTINIINEATFSRQNSFRNSFRRLLTANKVRPFPFSPPQTKRCVTFSDKPIVYSISQ